MHLTGSAHQSGAVFKWLFALVSVVSYSYAFGQTSIPEKYTVSFGFTYKWHNLAEGGVREEMLLKCDVAIDENKVLITPSALKAPSNIVQAVWATSPYRTNEWIVYGFGSKKDGLFDRITIDHNPTRGGSDLGANLGRILYIPSTHPTYQSVNGNERYFIEFESSSYKPSEVTFQISEKKFDGRSVIDQLVAYTPKYYKQGISATKSQNVEFKGDAPTRRLWQISILQYTNWLGVLLPLKFNYTRYQDPQNRVKNEDLTPVVTCDGELISVKAEAETDISKQLAPKLGVVDLRFKDEKGLEASVYYDSAPGLWPVVGSDEYKSILATNKMLHAKYSTSGAPRPKVSIGFVLIVALLLAIPFFVLRRVVGTNSNKQEPTK